VQVIGILSDSQGDLQAFDAAYELLLHKGARRFIFAGGRYSDLDEWVSMRKRRVRPDGSYSDLDFLADVTNFLGEKDPVTRPPAFVEDEAAPSAPGEDVDKLKARFVRVPDKDSLQYLDPSVPRKAMDMIGDALCCVVHDKNDLTREDLQNALVFVHGGEEEPKVVQIGPRYFVTGGKLTGAAKQTCGMLELVERNLRFSAFGLDGEPIVDGQLLVLDRRNKLSVK
jgi:hypothetical protein